MRARVSYTELIKKYDEHLFSHALPCKKGKGIKELESILLSDIKAKKKKKKEGEEEEEEEEQSEGEQDEEEEEGDEAEDDAEDVRRQLS